MAGAISGLGTNYNLPNYTGPLLQLIPNETPFFTAIGGINGGGQVESTEMEWQTFDFRSAGQNVALEGAAAPTAVGRVRANVTNLVEIHQSKVSVSYSKLAAVGLKSGTNNALPNPVTNETDWQVEQELAQMKRDCEYSFIQGIYNKPTDNTTTRQTKGLLNAIVTNVTNNGTNVTGLSASASAIAETSTARANGDAITFSSVGAATLINTNSTYYVVGKTTNAFGVSATKGGTAIVIGTATVAVNAMSTNALTTDDVEKLLQLAYDGGGIADQATATLMVNSSQKRAISTAYAGAYGKYVENSRTIAGVNFSTLITNFGTLNVMTSRFVPQDKIIAVSLDQCRPVFLETPGKGHFFAEPLAKVGASDDVQLYGEVGLAYGNEKAHAVLGGLKLP